MRITKISLLLLTIALLQGCVAAAVVAIASSATVINDRRSLGNQIDDEAVELDSINVLSREQALESTHIQVVSFNGTVLVVGQASTPHLRDMAIRLISELNGVAHLHNQIRIAKSTVFTVRNNDIWITSKVKAALFAEKNTDATNIKVITENGEVFLMGLMQKDEADAAVEVARNISGVKRVIKAFEYLQ